MTPGTRPDPTVAPPPLNHPAQYVTPLFPNGKPQPEQTASAYPFLPCRRWIPLDKPWPPPQGEIHETASAATLGLVRSAVAVHAVRRRGPRSRRQMPLDKLPGPAQLQAYEINYPANFAVNLLLGSLATSFYERRHQSRDSEGASEVETIQPSSDGCDCHSFASR